MRMEYFTDQYHIKVDTYGEIIINDMLQNVELWIRKTEEGMILHQLSSKNAESVDVVIPRRLPSGYQIDILRGIIPIKGKFGKITISNGITVGNAAFAYSDVKEVVWPDDCVIIPQKCFYNSNINKLFNIDNVVEILDKAFSGSRIKKISWPALCPHIPADCFYGSKLEEIDNLINVERVSQNAFFGTKLSSLDLSSTSIAHLEERSLAGLPKRCNVTLPYYVTREEFEKSTKGNF